mmetsp:Transcript_81830/g.218841  ORF Transcript_81830/g.218841 Transcript_81830/m.218841 type:complete len:302 (-) Transcript_81830:23-928(-)
MALLQSHQRRQPCLRLPDGSLRSSQLLVQLRDASFQPVHCGSGSRLLKLRHRRGWLLQNRRQRAQQRRVKSLCLLQESAYLLYLFLHLLLFHGAPHQLRKRGLNTLHRFPHLQHSLYCHLLLAPSRHPSSVHFALRIQSSQPLHGHGSRGFQLLLSAVPSFLCLRHSGSELSTLSVDAAQGLVGLRKTQRGLLLLDVQVLGYPRHHLLVHGRPILLLKRKCHGRTSQQNLQGRVLQRTFLKLCQYGLHTGSHGVHRLRYRLPGALHGSLLGGHIRVPGHGVFDWRGVVIKETDLSQTHHAP